MFIMADLGDEHTVAGSNEKVLCVIHTHQDGSFDMTPGFSSAGQKYRFEDDHGGSPAAAGASTAVNHLGHGDTFTWHSGTQHKGSVILEMYQMPASRSTSSTTTTSP